MKPRKEPLIWVITLLAAFVVAGAAAQNQKPNVVNDEIFNEYAPQ